MGKNKKVFMQALSEMKYFLLGSALVLALVTVMPALAQQGPSGGGAGGGMQGGGAGGGMGGGQQLGGVGGGGQQLGGMGGQQQGGMGGQGMGMQGTGTQGISGVQRGVGSGTSMNRTGQGMQFPGQGQGVQGGFPGQGQGVQGGFPGGNGASSSKKLMPGAGQGQGQGQGFGMGFGMGQNLQGSKMKKLDAAKLNKRFAKGLTLVQKAKTGFDALSKKVTAAKTDKKAFSLISKEVAKIGKMCTYFNLSSVAQLELDVEEFDCPSYLDDLMIELQDAEDRGAALEVLQPVYDEFATQIQNIEDAVETAVDDWNTQLEEEQATPVDTEDQGDGSYY